MKFNFPIVNFTAGEWSPKMLARLDTEQYARACKELTNIIPQLQGGAVYRGATVAKNSRTVPEEGMGGDPLVDYKSFQFYLDYWADQFYTGTEKGRSNIKMIPYVGSRTDIGYPPVGFFVFVNGALGFSQGDSATPVALSSGTTFVPRKAWDCHYVQVGEHLILVDNTGEVPPQVVMQTYTLGVWDGFEVSNWLGSAFAPISGKPWAHVPWGEINALDSNVTISASATTGTVTLTASASYFTSSMVGAYIRLCNGTNREGVAKITAYTSGTSVTATVVLTLPNASFQYGSTTNAASFWQFHAWYNGNWPRTVTSFQGRTIFGGTPRQTDTIWGSRIGNYYDFEEVPSPHTTGTYGYAGAAYLADNSRPFELTSNSAEASNIQALCAAKTLMINTDRSEIVAYGSNGALGPNDVTFESSSSFGAESVQPIRVNNFMTFVERGGKSVRDLTFNFQEDQFRSSNLAFMVENYFRAQHFHEKEEAVIEELCSFKYGEGSTLLAARDRRGLLFSCTIDRDYQVNAWSRINIGVSPEQQDEDVTARKGAVDNPEDYYAPARCMSICYVPGFTFSYESGGDSYYSTVRPKVYIGVMRLRISSGTPSWYFSIEELQDPWERGQPRNSGEISETTTGYDIVGSPTMMPHYLDCAEYAVPSDATTPLDGTVPTKTWKVNPYGAFGMTPMRGQTVSVYADTVYIGEVEIADDEAGTFEIPVEASNVVLGFKYKGRLVTMPIEQGGQIGQPKGRIKRIDEVVFDLYNTGAVAIGAEGGETDEIPIWDTSTALGDAAEYFTGLKVVEFLHGFDRRQCVVLEQNFPVPLHILSISARGATYE